MANDCFDGENGFFKKMLSNEKETAETGRTNARPQYLLIIAWIRTYGRYCLSVGNFYDPNKDPKIFYYVPAVGGYYRTVPSVLIIFLEDAYKIDRT